MKLRRRDTGEETALTPGLLVGRSSECGLSLRESSVSRKHARLELRDQEWWVVDLGSSNGTLRNGQREGEFPLAGGDRVTFGAIEFDVVGDAPAAASASAAAPAAASPGTGGAPDLGDEIEIEGELQTEPPKAPEPVVEEDETAPSASPGLTAAERERARLRQELKQPRRSRGLGDLSQLSLPVQLLVVGLGLLVAYGVVLGVRWLMGAIAGTA